MKTDFKYFTMEEVDLPGRKTKVWKCISRRGVVLGRVSWFSTWRSYCFFPASETAFSAGCLFDINSFISEAMKERKGGS